MTLLLVFLLLLLLTTRWLAFHNLIAFGKKYLLIITFLSFFSLINAQHFDGYHTVRVEQGFIKGRLWKIDGRQVQVFLGVPFAEPPVGIYRFQKPLKKQPWEGDHTAYEYGPPCIQFMDFHEHDRFSGQNMKRQREDCLYLNIFSPYDSDPEILYPVIVWIHGGSFLAGSSDSGIDMTVTIKNLILRNVTLVTLNYRLGPLGFLSTSLPDAKGNFGIWDQIEALKWIQANIREFKGDPNSVTVMGESAGGSSASLLALTPAAEGLLHRAVLMSGSIAAGWAVKRIGESNWNIENLYKYLTCRNKINSEESLSHVEPVHQDYECNYMKQPLHCDAADSERDIFECLQLKADFSNSLMRKAFTYEFGLGQILIDGEIIPSSLNHLLANYSRVPILIGTAELEWAHKKAIFYGFKSYTTVNERMAKEKAQLVVQQSLLPYLDTFVCNDTLKLMAQVALHNYLIWNSSGPTWEMTEFVESLQKMESDIEFTAPMVKEIDSYLQNNQSVYLYSFEYLPSKDLIEEEWVDVNLFGLKRKVRTERKLPIKYAFHGLDHAFIFTEGYSSNIFFPYGETERQISDALCQFLANFAKFGNPTVQPVHGIFWPVVNEDHSNYMKFAWPLEMVENNARWSKASFWNDLMSEIATFAAENGMGREFPFTNEEQLQLAAFRRAWWALWVLVAAIAFLLWIIIICLVTQKCLDVRSRHYKNIIVANV
ncbi:Acetylcholinesterase [Trichinella nativa]|uniref:Acetylcholinesterase n=1 Tax=Trichinella nativa TaxID=6335 RepID=A0A0V1L316_9BILA|nr:Acetylcholinesterase [Trichinella sp. T6]KRZ53920.1 Acetylcholinesterase [Trichinella nativa]